MELENVERIEKLLRERFKFTKLLERSFNNIKHNLRTYEVDERLLERVNNTLYDAHLLDDAKQIEEIVKELSSSFWE